MERKELKKVVESHCKQLKRSLGDREISLITSLSDLAERQLINGSGNADKEYLFADSSTALGVNYFSLYEETHPECELKYEWKEESPLKVGGKSNLDIWIKEGKVIKFYESKFLEPYYMSNSQFTSSYFDSKNYKMDERSAHKLISIIENIDKKEFTYYNVSQLIRHLMAIFNHICLNTNEYNDIEEVQLVSICWEMPERFIEELGPVVGKRSISYLKKRITKLTAERKSSEEFINSIIKEVLQPELEKKSKVKFLYTTNSYNDAIKNIETSIHIEDFKEQYYL